jgi:hypothetical protein
LLKSFLFALFFLFSFADCAPIKKAESLEQSSTTSLEETVSSPLEFKKLSLCAILVPLQKQASEKGENRYQLKFWNPIHATKSGPYSSPPYEVRVILWMKMPDGGDHGSFPVVIEPSKDEKGVNIEGVYDVTKVRFTMKGDWEIQIKIKSNQDIVDEVTFFETVF